MITISPQELRQFSQFLAGISGISLDDSKAYLFENRLGVMLREQQCSSFSELFARIRSDAAGRLERRFLDLITTGETSFFRDRAPFELLQQKLLPELLQRKIRTRPSLRIWCAACSTGQEAYSVAMLLDELTGPGSGQDIRILGTDISEEAVKVASRGIYNQVEVERGLTPARRARHLVPTGDAQWRLREGPKALATFRIHNLLSDLASLGRFDLVLCRNVAIYFSEKERVGLFRRLAQVLTPEGYLLIGATESLSGLCPPYLTHRALGTVYYGLQG